MNPYIIVEDNPNELFGVRACSFAGQQKSADCGGKWFVVPTQHVRVANPLAPHICVCANHLAEANRAVAPPEFSPKAAGRRAVKKHARALEELSL